MPPKKNIEKKEEKKEEKKDVKKDITDSSDSESPISLESPSSSLDKKKEIDEEKEEIDVRIYPLSFKIPEIKKSIFDSEVNVQFSENINYPNFEYGFHHFIHQSKNYLNDETKKFEGKKKVWNVLNRYEPIIDNYAQSITDISKIYFEPVSKIEIINYSFYKLWDLFMYYDLIDLKKENLTTAHISDNAGAFAQATIYYRDLFAKKVSKNDKCNIVVLEENEIKNVIIQEVDKKFSDYFEKEKRLSVTKSEDTIKQKCDLVTADGGFGELNENLQEQESPALLIYEILSAIKILKKGGHFVCKFFETFTGISMKIISLLSNIFDNVFFSKPLLSKLSSCEKYAVCMNFKYNENDKEFKKTISMLENIAGSIKKQKESNVVDIFSDFKVPRELIVSVTNMNIIFSNQHLKNINNIVTFIRNQVYSGEEYHDRRNEQIEGTLYWTGFYLPKPDDINKTRDKAQIIMKKSLSITENERKLLNNKLVDIVN
jgi:23S rRNA U2552 (ribose-2'-O)-methylase RlmE/FtsJ